MTSQLPEPEVTQLWSAQQRASHSLHEISYRACFKPNLPEHFIDQHTQPGDAVLDPFMGRGTTPLQAHLMGRRAYGNDVNPLCLMMTRPRLKPPTIESIADRLRIIPGHADPPTSDEQLLVFYHPETLTQLAAYKAWFQERTADGVFDDIDDWIRMVCISRLSGHSPGFFSVKTMPPNQAVSVKRQRIINERHERRPEPRDTRRLIMRKTRSLLRSGYPRPAPEPMLRTGRSDELGYIDDSTIDLIVTSPPFLDVVDYRQDNWLRAWFADIPIADVHLDSHSTTDKWTRWIRRSLLEFARVLRTGGTLVFEVGEVRKGRVQLEHHVADAMAGLPFDVREVVIIQQAFTKTSHTWGITNNTAGTNTNRIIVMTCCK